MQFPTGGIARERTAQNRLDSGADSTVWMEEVDSLFAMDSIEPRRLPAGHFCALSERTYMSKPSEARFANDVTGAHQVVNLGGAEQVGS